MRDIVKNRRTNLRKWIDDHHNGSQASFMELTGINQGELSALLKDKSFGEKKARLLEDQSGMPFLYLDKDPVDNVSPIDAEGLVPLISWVAAGSWSTIECRDMENVVEKWLLCPEKHSPDTYALRVSGISMQNMHSPLSFEEGDIIFVDPTLEAENKSCVVAYNARDNETTFKQLIIDEMGKKYLVPLNPNWPEQSLPVDDQVRVIGVVIGKWVSIKELK